MTTIKIWDVGCGVEANIDNGQLRVTSSGGCPVEEILGTVRVFRDREKTARAVMVKWLSGYEGGLSAARLNNLWVEVDGVRVYA